ncbi:MAG: DUF2795 domain-containing protein [Actinobacteria bacterium]|nr:DUF2795 domain-containing protein [Actinomycetota bacterium]
MDRETSKHGSRIDDEMKKEVDSVTRGAPVESRAQEGREKEPPGEDQPEVREGPLRSGDHPDDALDPEEIENRSNIARFLDQVVFPADRQSLLANAQEHHAPEKIVGQLQQLPEGTQFENVQDVWEALGGHAEERF